MNLCPLPLFRERFSVFNSKRFSRSSRAAPEAGLSRDSRHPTVEFRFSMSFGGHEDGIYSNPIPNDPNLEDIETVNRLKQIGR